MITIITLTYCLGVWLLFSKLKLIKTTPSTLATAVAIGVVLIGGIIIGWKFSAPYSTQLVATRFVVLLTPQANGLIKKVYAKPNVPLKKGDKLFQVDPAPFQYAVDESIAQLDAAQKTVRQLAADLEVAKAGVTKAEANTRAAKAEMDVAKTVRTQNVEAMAKLTVDQLTDQYIASQAGVDQAKEGVAQAEFELESAKANEKSIESQLSIARFNLDRCTLTAPAAGFVTNWQVREGTEALKYNFLTSGSFVDTKELFLYVSLPQNVVKFVKLGDPADIALKTRPAEIVTGKVDAFAKVTGEGQFEVTGTLPQVASIKSQGKYALRIKLDDPTAAKDVALGTAGAAAIYTDRWKPFQMISRIVVRIQAWKYYLPV